MYADDISEDDVTLRFNQLKGHRFNPRLAVSRVRCFTDTRVLLDAVRGALVVALAPTQIGKRRASDFRRRRARTRHRFLANSRPAWGNRVE